MVKIRLTRHGAKRRPYYHVVVADIDACRDGKFLEQVGTYDPVRDQIALVLDRIDHWLGVGAQPTTRVHKILKVYRRQAAAATEAAPAA